MNGLSRVSRLRGLVIDVAVPNWLVWVGRTAIGAALVGILALILGAGIFEAVHGRSDTVGEQTGPSLGITAQGFEARPIQYQVQLTAGSENAADLDKEWTLLMSSGAVHWANVVEGPGKLAPGESGTFVLTFLFEPTASEGEPMALRWDPGRKVGASVALPGKP